MGVVSGSPASVSASGGGAADKQAAFAKGREGVIGGPTGVCAIEQDQVIYRGAESHDLAEHASFE
ncbi:MAG: hypothetical protein ACK5UW_10395, partial [bacterium]